MVVTHNEPTAVRSPPGRSGPLVLRVVRDQGDEALQQNHHLAQRSLATFVSKLTLEQFTGTGRVSLSLTLSREQTVTNTNDIIFMDAHKKLLNFG